MKSFNKLPKIAELYNKIATEAHNAGIKNISEAHVSHYLHNPTQTILGLSKKDSERFLKAISPFLPYNNKYCTISKSSVATEQMSLLFDDIPYPQPPENKFTFIDLFAGIGGFRLAMQSIGGKCLFSSEWDKYAQLTYLRNYGEIPFGDIRNISEVHIPDHDILCAGFPCQPFSLAGVSKKNSLGKIGRAHV